MRSDAKPPAVREIRIAVALTALLLCLPVIGVVARPQLQKADFQVLYTGGLMLREGRAAKLYDIGEQQRAQEQFAGRPGVLPDPYPPFHALLLAPLTLLGYRGAYLAWGAINIALWVTFQGIVWRELSGRIQFFRYLLLSAAFFPLWLTLMEGQTSILVMLSFALSFVYLKRKRDYRAGLALGLGLIKFQVILPFVFIFLLRRKWKLIAGVAIAASVLVLLSIATVGPSGILSYANLLIDTVRHPMDPSYSSINTLDMPTISGFMSSTLRGMVRQGWVAAVSLALSSVLAFLVSWYWERAKITENNKEFDRMFAAALGASLLGSAHLHPHDLVLMLLPVLVLVGSLQWGATFNQRWLITFAISILYGVPLYYVQWGPPLVLAPAVLVLVLAALSLAHRVPKDTAGGERAELAAVGAGRRASVTG